MQLCIQWFHNNLMKVNPDKFQIMLLSPDGNNDIVSLEITINENCFLTPNVEVINILGVTIDNRLNFDIHIRLIF